MNSLGNNFGVKTKNPVIALGVFDGVHRGHREIFRRTIARAKKIGGTSVVYTFDPHPVRVVAPSSAPPMINTIAQRVELIRQTGIDCVVVEKFNRKFSQQTPERFFQETIVKRLKAREIFAGYNFTFGVRRSGTIETLETLAKAAGARVTKISPYLWHETLVSSTQVRQFLAAGELSKAEDLLARPYFLDGGAIPGPGPRGK